MSFDDFYFGIKSKNISNVKVGYILIDESIFNRLCRQFHKDYKYIVETEDYKNSYGYGFKYTLNNKDTIILLNRWKDEVNNTNSKMYISESSWINIKKDFKLEDYQINFNKEIE